MIVAPKFPFDWDDATMLIQHGEYSDVVVKLVAAAAWRYLSAEDLVGIETDLGRIANRLYWGSFDHRTAQAAHDWIAAWFRHKRGRPPLFAHLRAADDEIRDEWRQFASEEIARLVNEPDVTRNIITAVGYPHTQQGMAAETALADFLRKRYATMFDAQDETCMHRESDEPASD